MSDEEQMLDISAAKVWLHTHRQITVSTDTLQRWCRNGHLPGVDRRPGKAGEKWVIPVSALQTVEQPRRGAKPISTRRCRVCGRVAGEEGIDGKPVHFYTVRSRLPYAGGVKTKTICGACERAQRKAQREARRRGVPAGWLTTRQVADRLAIPVQVVIAHLDAFDTQYWERMYLIRETSIQSLADLLDAGWLTVGAAATRMGVPVYLVKAHLDEVTHVTWKTILLIHRISCDDRLHPYMSAEVAEAMAEQAEAARLDPNPPDGWLTIGEAATRLNQTKAYVQAHLDEFETQAWAGELVLGEASVAPPQGWLRVSQVAERMGMTPQALYLRLDDFQCREWHGMIYILESSIPDQR